MNEMKGHRGGTERRRRTRNALRTVISKLSCSGAEQSGGTDRFHDDASEEWCCTSSLLPSEPHVPSWYIGTDKEGSTKTVQWEWLVPPQFALESEANTGVLAPTVDLSTIQKTGSHDSSEATDETLPLSQPLDATLTSSPVQQQQQRQVRFADTEGKPISTISHYEGNKASALDPNWKSLLVLLLSPEDRQFEVIHVAYHVQDRLTVHVLLDQLPDLAMTSHLACQDYIGLCRNKSVATSSNNTNQDDHHETNHTLELVNLISIQDYKLLRDEMLVAIPYGMKRQDIVGMAEPLWNNRQAQRQMKQFALADGFRRHNVTTLRFTQKGGSG